MVLVCVAGAGLRSTAQSQDEGIPGLQKKMEWRRKKYVSILQMGSAASNRELMKWENRDQIGDYSTIIPYTIVGRRFWK